MRLIPGIRERIISHGIEGAQSCVFSFILHYEQLNCELDISANFLGLEAHARHTAAIAAATSAASSSEPIDMAPLQDKITRAETVLLFNFNTQQTEARKNNTALAAQIAGEILYYVWRVDTSGAEGSIKKSAFIVEKIFGIGERRAKEYWSRYKDISHFMAAIRTMERFPGTEELSLEEYAMTFFSISFFFQNLAVARREKRTKTTLLNADTAWTVPPAVFVMAGTEIAERVVKRIISTPLTQKEQEALDGYLVAHPN